MSDLESKIVATRRSEFGTRACRRLRKQGSIPGNVYGHNQVPVAISAPGDVIDSLVHAGHKVVDLDIDGASDTAMFREVQWDTFGIRIQHFDLVRVGQDERVVVEVPIEMRGNAPGVIAGGVLEQTMRTVTVECRAVQIPDSITVRIHALEIGDAVHVSDLELPEGVKVDAAPEETVLHIVQPTVLEEAEGEEEIGAVEPEVIGRKEEGEESSE